MFPQLVAEGGKHHAPDGVKYFPMRIAKSVVDKARREHCGPTLVKITARIGIAKGRQENKTRQGALKRVKGTIHIKIEQFTRNHGTSPF